MMDVDVVLATTGFGLLSFFSAVVDVATALDSPTTDVTVIMDAITTAVSGLSSSSSSAVATTTVAANP